MLDLLSCLYGTVLHCTALHCTTLHHTALFRRYLSLPDSSKSASCLDFQQLYWSEREGDIGMVVTGVAVGGKPTNVQIYLEANFTARDQNNKSDNFSCYSDND